MPDNVRVLDHTAARMQMAILRDAEEDQAAMRIYNQGLQFLPDDVDLLFARALHAESMDELALAERFLSEQITSLREDSSKLPDGRSAEGQALINLCHALLSSNEFVYID